MVKVPMQGSILKSSTISRVLALSVVGYIMDLVEGMTREDCDMCWYMLMSHSNLRSLRK